MALFTSKKKGKDNDSETEDDFFEPKAPETEEGETPKQRAKREKREQKLKEKQDKKDRKGMLKGSERKGGSKLAFLLLLFLLGGIAAFAFGVIRFNWFGLRDNQLRGLLENIPVVNNILPAVEHGAEEAELSAEELSAENTALVLENENLQQEVSDLQVQNDKLMEEAQRLLDFEERLAQFNEDKAAFDEEVAMGDPQAYENYYSQISPENAENIYREVVGIVVSDEELQSYVSTYENMDTGNAAAIFDGLVRSDLDLIVMILKNLSSDKRADIIGDMETTGAQQVTKRMAPAANP